MSSDTTQTCQLSGLQQPLNNMREERDLYRAVLLLPADALAAFLKGGAGSARRMRRVLAERTRDAAAFKQKLQNAHSEISRFGKLSAEAGLGELLRPIEALSADLQRLLEHESVSGNELLPLLPTIEELYTRLWPPTAVEKASARAGRPGRHHRNRKRRQSDREPPKLALALRELAAQLAATFGRSVKLETSGLDQVPADWEVALFDICSQLLRNAVEHGIESAEQREARGKRPAGNVSVDFISRDHHGFELLFQDDGGGLEAAGILNSAAERGLLEQDDPRLRDPRKALTMIFKRGVTTKGPERGNGMDIVRTQVQRLQGQIQLATKPERFTRVRIRLPAPPAATKARARSKG
ncbi:MAG TPA: ATP-binding protein [Steroidobacteraceae bacterium]